MATLASLSRSASEAVCYLGRMQFAENQLMGRSARRAFLRKCLEDFAEELANSRDEESAFCPQSWLPQEGRLLNRGAFLSHPPHPERHFFVHPGMPPLAHLPPMQRRRATPRFFPRIKPNQQNIRPVPPHMPSVSPVWGISTLCPAWKRVLAV